ncbi:MAG: UV DNA damage repair endonuclease UvsE [Chloroflexi bacterium]|nr:UV DNA damage repair endonuclease UvsE [Chloroflexota bacterium]MBU1746085.1 UV DNA damage repair endonuclease UvsE [Chloroflexota bacterium]
MRLGVAVKILGQAVKTHDTRRWQHDPHLSVSLVYLRDVFGYLDRQGVRMYRMASDLAPYVTHPDMTGFHGQIEECAVDLALLGQLADERELRLSFHVPISSVLNAPEENIAHKAAADLSALARILDAMGLGPEAVVVTHVGGTYGDRFKARERFAARVLALPDATRQRLALEHDDQQFSVADVLWVHQRTGVRVVFDRLHLQCHNPEGLDEVEALAACLRTWPAGVTPKVHFSSPRTAMHLVERRDAEAGRVERTLRVPHPTEHADFIDPFAFVAFLRAAQAAGLPDFDVMLEGSGKDLAVLRLREHLAAYAPDLLTSNGEIHSTPDRRPLTTDRQP